MINLDKGDDVTISLKHISVGLGWDPSAKANEDFDLDASAFMLGVNKKIPSDPYFVFYNNLISPDGAVKSMGDDRTGGNSQQGDDETIVVDLTKVSPFIQEILFTATIHKAVERGQNFGRVSHAYIRIYDTDTKAEIAHYDLNEDFSTETAVEFGKLIKKGSAWVFEAVGQGDNGGLRALVTRYAN